MKFLIFQISTEKCISIKDKKGLADFVYYQTGVLVSAKKKSSDLMQLLPKNEFVLMKGE